MRYNPPDDSEKKIENESDQEPPVYWEGRPRYVSDQTAFMRWSTEVEQTPNVVDDAFINNNKATVLEVFLDPEQDFIPKVKGVLKEDGSIFPPPIEEMSPLLSLNELKENMIVEISEKSKLIKR